MNKKCKVCGSKLSLTVKPGGRYNVVQTTFHCPNCKVDYKASPSQLHEDKTVWDDYLPR